MGTLTYLIRATCVVSGEIMDDLGCLIMTAVAFVLLMALSMAVVSLGAFTVGQMVTLWIFCFVLALVTVALFRVLGVW